MCVQVSIHVSIMFPGLKETGGAPSVVKLGTPPAAAGLTCFIKYSIYSLCNFAMLCYLGIRLWSVVTCLLINLSTIDLMRGKTTHQGQYEHTIPSHASNPA